MEIIKYDPKFKDDFIKFNPDWIVDNFGFLENEDKERVHKGCGSAVFKAAMDWAISHGAKRHFLLSNSRLKPAIHIYEKFGFREIKLDDYEYVRGDIAFEYIVGE